VKNTSGKHKNPFSLDWHLAFTLEIGGNHSPAAGGISAEQGSPSSAIPDAVKTNNDVSGSHDAVRNKPGGDDTTCKHSAFLPENPGRYSDTLSPFMIIPAVENRISKPVGWSKFGRTKEILGCSRNEPTACI